MPAPAATLRAPPIALTMGEPAGIGGELTLKAWLRRGESMPAFFAIDDPERLRVVAGQLGAAVAIRTIAAPSDAAYIFGEALPVLPLTLATAVTPGRPDPANAAAVIASIDRAVALALRGEIAAIVTNPISKKTLYDAGFPDPGHTEYLARRSGSTVAPVMMLVGGGLRVVPITVHMALRDALHALTTDLIVATGRTVVEALRRDFAIAAPRLAVAGLNPHAGEGATLGTEDRDVIAPAVAALRAIGIDASGPLPADTMFHPAARARYDAALCAYHDQALIPVKTIAFDEASNVTLGLPFVRTSPDHGTAFDIAGTGRADPTSLMTSLRLAATLAARRADATAGPS